MAGSHLQGSELTNGKPDKLQGVFRYLNLIGAEKVRVCNREAFQKW